MFPNHHVIGRLVEDRQAEIRREVQGQRYDSGIPTPEARGRLVKLVGLLAAAGLLISFLV